MRLRELAITLFICSSVLVGCSKSKDNITSNYFYEFRHTPNDADFIVFNNEKTKFLYNSTSGNWFCRFEKDKIFASHLVETNEEKYIGYVKDYKTIVIEQFVSVAVAGEYELTDIKFKGEWE